MFETSSDLFGHLRQSSAIFGNLSKMFGYVLKMLGNVHLASGSSEQFWKIFGKWSEIFRKSLKTALLAR